jgi:hypothetical protein
MRAETRRQIVLGAVVLVLAVAIYRVWPDSTSKESQGAAPPPTSAAAPSSAAAAPRGRTTASAPAAPGTSAPDVHLTALSSARPKPAAGERDLFRYRARVSPAAAAQARLAAVPPPVVPTGPPPPPPLPPIAFKFIGVVEATEQAARIAVLSDGKNVFHGREGDIIEGRFRILRIGAESLEMAYLDGRGRQTIRLSGS